jgi:hypothetical protein
MDITLKNIFEDYWSQILLILTGIGYLLKISFDFFLKKKEINYGINHKNKMDALIRFFKAYAELKSMWNKLPISQILKNELSAFEIDNQIQPPLNNFEASIIELQIYFDENMYENFKKIEKNMNSINRVILNLCFDDFDKRILTMKVNDYTFHKEYVEKQNAIILKQISNNLFRKSK